MPLKLDRTFSKISPIEVGGSKDGYELQHVKFMHKPLIGRERELGVLVVLHPREQGMINRRAQVLGFAQEADSIKHNERAAYSPAEIKGKLKAAVIKAVMENTFQPAASIIFNPSLTMRTKKEEGEEKKE
jgi:hypothetical protein